MSGSREPHKAAATVSKKINHDSARIGQITAAGSVNVAPQGAVRAGRPAPCEQDRGQEGHAHRDTGSRHHVSQRHGQVVAFFKTVGQRAARRHGTQQEDGRLQDRRISSISIQWPPPASRRSCAPGR